MCCMMKAGQDWTYITYTLYTVGKLSKEVPYSMYKCTISNTSGSAFFHQALTVNRPATGRL